MLRKSNQVRGSRWRRWAMRGTVAVVVFLVLAVGTTQVLLTTDLPRRLVISQVQGALGLRVEAKSLSTGWLGRTRLVDVTLSLPLADKAFLRVPELEVRHTSLPVLLLTRSVSVEALRLRDAELLVLQGPGGRWNVQEVAELLGRLGGEEEARKSEDGGDTSLPAIEVERAKIQVIDNQGHRTEIGPLALRGWRHGALVWRYSAAISGQLDVEGELVPAGSWPHRLSIRLERISAWLEPFVAGLPRDLGLWARWEGGVRQDVVQGRLEIERLEAGGLQAEGTLVVRLGGAKAMFYPEDLGIRLPRGSPMLLRAGEIGLDDVGVSAGGLFVAAAGGQARVDGKYEWKSGTADLWSQWQSVRWPRGVVHDGRLTASVRTPWPGQPQVKVELHSEGAVGENQGRWTADARIDGWGGSWGAMQWRLEAPRLAWSGAPPLDFSGLQAAASTRGDTITLDDLRLGDSGRLRGNGQYSRGSGASWIWLQGRELLIPGEEATFQFVLESWGNRQQVGVKQLYLRTGELELTARGDYVYDRPNPLSLDVYVTQAQEARRDGGTEARREAEEELVGGVVQGEGHLVGTLRPVAIQVSGRLLAENLRVGDRPLGQVRMKVGGALTADAASLRFTELRFLGGDWQLEGRYLIGRPRTGPRTNPPRPRPPGHGPDALRLQVRVRDLSVDQLGELLHLAAADGKLDGQWTIDIFQLRRNRMAIVAGSGFTVRGLRLGGLAADWLEAQTVLDEGSLRLEEVTMRRGEGSVAGRVSLNLMRPTLLDVKLAATAWPMEVGLSRSSERVLLWGDTRLTVDAAEATAHGRATARVQVRRGEQSLGEMEAGVVLDGRKVEIRNIQGKAFGGQVEGRAFVDLDAPRATRLRLAWSGVRGERLAEAFPMLEGVRGQFGGTVRISEADEPRAVEPMRLDVAVRSLEGGYRAVQLGDLETVGYFDLGGWPELPGSQPATHNSQLRPPPASVPTAFALRRFVLDRATLGVAGGTVRMWARTSRHQAAPLASQFIAELEGLDLDQIVRAAVPRQGPTPGRVHGQIVVVGNLSRKREMFGEATIRLRDSDLISFGPIRGLYDLMHLGLEGQRPTGHGRLEMRLEAATLEVLSMRYFNRGVEARAQGTVREIWQMPHSPLRATIVGTARPLKNIRLPVLADVDRIFSVLQGQVTSVAVGGTVSDPTWRPIAFSDIGQSMRSLLLGDVRAMTAGTAGP